MVHLKYQCIFVMLLVTYAQNCGSVSKGLRIQLVMSLNFFGLLTSLKFCLLWLVSYKVNCVYSIRLGVEQINNLVSAADR